MKSYNLINANVITLEPKNSTAQSITIHNGKIEALNSINSNYKNIDILVGEFSTNSTSFFTDDFCLELKKILFLHLFGHVWNVVLIILIQSINNAYVL